MKNVVVLGNSELQKVPIYSILVKRKDRYLHFHFVGKLLNDLFGIQLRTGCSWASVYGQQLLGINLEKAREFKKALCRGHEMLRMGYVRLNFAYFMTKAEIDYVLSAIEFVSKYGWLFLPSYTFTKETAEFYASVDTDHKERNWLGEISYSKGFMTYQNSNAFINIPGESCDYAKVFDEAREHLLESIKEAKKTGRGKGGREIIEEEFRYLDEYLYADEVVEEVRGVEVDDILKEWDSVYEEPTSSKETYQPAPLIEETKSIEDDFEDALPGAWMFEDMSSEPKLLPIVTPSKELSKLVGEAIKDFDMIKEGDSILIALSGGKDSLSLLHILRYFQKKAPVRFSLGAVTIDPKTVEYDPSPLKGYLKELGVPYFYEVDNLVERAEKSMQNNSIWAFCSRMKRGMIYTWARREGYNVIAMGQHLDDLAESFVMSAFNNGNLRTMKANYVIDKGDLRVIRPLVYCRERLFKEFSEKWNLPVITENWPAWFSEPKERHRIKLLLAQQEHEIPTLFPSLLKCMKPLMTMNLNDLIREKNGEKPIEKEPEPNFWG